MLGIRSVVVVVVLHIFKVHPRRLKACLPKTFKRKHLVVTFLGEPDCCLLISQIYMPHYFLSAFFLPLPYFSSSFLPSLKLTYLTLFFHLFSSPVYLQGCAEGQVWCANHTVAPSVMYWTTKADHFDLVWGTRSPLDGCSCMSSGRQSTH